QAGKGGQCFVVIPLRRRVQIGLVLVALTGNTLAIVVLVFKRLDKSRVGHPWSGVEFGVGVTAGLENFTCFACHTNKLLCCCRAVVCRLLYTGGAATCVGGATCIVVIMSCCNCPIMS